MRLLRILALIAIVFAASSGPVHAALAVAIEYYDAALDHYFITALPDEIAALDAGQFPGWVRTGLSFNVYAAGSAAPGSVPVCRFYGTPAAGLNSHFYSASAAECAEVEQNWPTAWLLESNDVFELFLPDLTTGQCPANSVPVYRAWNQRSDSNHRFTTNLAVFEQMLAMGYAAEGYGPGPTPTAMCSPTGSTASGAPVCSPSATNPFPYVGATITLSSNCTSNPTSFVWTGCTSSVGLCSATSNVPGVQTYTVVASNPSGTSASASINVQWLELPPVPDCAMIVTANTVPPVVGSLALLNAACTNTPTRYNWTNCGSKTNLCQAIAAVAGIQMYSVSATNPAGTGAQALASIDWQSAPPPPPGMCGQFPSYLYSDDGWASTRLITEEFTQAPAFASDGVWVVRLAVPPSDASVQLGSITVAEFGGPTTSRQATLSTVPCDFRPVDPSGINGPLAVSNGPTVQIFFSLVAASQRTAGLTPGQVYYVNIRNWDIDTDSGSCPPAQGRCDVFMDLSLP